MVKGAVHKKDRIIISFDHGKVLAPKQGEEIRGFSVDGKNPIGAYARKGAIVIPVSEKPEFLYYAWKPWTQANLINAQGLPASTFKVKVE